MADAPRHDDATRLTAAGAQPPKISPYCTSLASKKILGSEGLPLTDRDVLDASNYCWCKQTGQILGPDREITHPEDCRKGRSCFESPFADLL